MLTYIANILPECFAFKKFTTFRTRHCYVFKPVGLLLKIIGIEPKKYDGDVCPPSNCEFLRLI